MKKKQEILLIETLLKTILKLKIIKTKNQKLKIYIFKSLESKENLRMRENAIIFILFRSAAYI